MLLKVVDLNIRELAAQSHVSTATITRFCHKLDCDGFVEFKIELKRFNEINKMPEIDDEITMLNQFFDYSKGKEFNEHINQAVEYITDSNFIVCLGIGQSGSMARYAARFFLMLVIIVNISMIHFILHQQINLKNVY